MAPPTATVTTATIAGTDYRPKTTLQASKDHDGAACPTLAGALQPGLEVVKAMANMLDFPCPPKFDDLYEERAYLKGRLAAAFRIFGKNGYDEGVAGHITVRDPVDPSTFWVNPFGLSFSLITASSLLHVSHTGAIISGGPPKHLNTAAFMIHSAVHAARPDVICAAHSHSIYGRAFCTLGRPLDIITQDACAFHDDIALYTSFNGIVLAEEEGRNIAKALGGCKAALLQNHGLLTVAGSVEAAVFWFVSLEKCCQVQLMADAAAGGRGGETKKIGRVEAEFTKKTVGSEIGGWFSAKPLFDLIEVETNGDYLK